MLVKKEPEELMAQTVVLYGSILLLLVYLMKFLKNVAMRSYGVPDSRREPACEPATCPHVTSRHAREERNTEERNESKPKRQRRRRHHKHSIDAWPHLEPCHSQDDYYD